MALSITITKKRGKDNVATPGIYFYIVVTGEKGEERVGGQPYLFVEVKNREIRREKQSRVQGLSK